MPWAKGESGNKGGRPKSPVRAKYAEAFREAIGTDRWKSIVSAIANMCDDPDIEAKDRIAAAKFIAPYLAGPPPKPVEEPDPSKEPREVGSITVTVAREKK